MQIGNFVGMKSFDAVEPRELMWKDSTQIVPLTQLQNDIPSNCL